MREENLFNILLTLEDISSLYLNIGDSIFTDIDLSSYSYNPRALNNSLKLLESLELVTKLDGCYSKEKNYDKLSFQNYLIDVLFLKYGEQILKLVSLKQQYDVEKKYFYILRNKIPLKFMGLIMLLNDYNEVYFEDNRVVIVGNYLKGLFVNKKRVKAITLKELEKRLLRQKELGNEAEEVVMEYEKSKLLKVGIELKPIQISLIDVSAGFDIVSYFSDDKNDEKYIEVKSCDDRYTFHFSQNEVRIAKEKKDRYFLYLVNRFNNTIEEIRNPFELLFNDGDSNWVIEPDGYKIHKI